MLPDTSYYLDLHLHVIIPCILPTHLSSIIPSTILSILLLSVITLLSLLSYITLLYLYYMI